MENDLVIGKIENLSSNTVIANPAFKELLSDIFVDRKEQDEFLAVLEKIVIGTALSIDTIKQCIPLMGKLSSRGFKPDKLLASFCRYNGVR